MAQPKSTPVPRSPRRSPLRELQAADASVALPAAPQGLLLPQPAGLLYAGGLLLSLLSPFAGLTLGFLYARQASPVARTFGRWCVGLAVLGWLLRMLAAALSSAVDGDDWLTQPYY
jgi:hypothetical protein